MQGRQQGPPLPGLGNEDAEIAGLDGDRGFERVVLEIVQKRDEWLEKAETSAVHGQESNIALAIAHGLGAAIGLMRSQIEQAKERMKEHG